MRRRTDPSLWKGSSRACGVTGSGGPNRMVNGCGMAPAKLVMGGREPFLARLRVRLLDNREPMLSSVVGLPPRSV